jgi:ferredoxin-NADP reductase
VTDHGELIELRLAAVEDLTPAIRKFVLVAAGEQPLPRFTAGAHIDVVTGAGVKRSYSLANDPQDTGRYVLAVLREAAGEGGSIWMHDGLAAGDIIKATPPKNQFPLAEQAAEHILIAGGIGVTPLLAMGHELSRGDKPFHLHYCTKSPAETAFMDEVKQVFGENLTFHHDGGDPAKGMDLAAELKDRPKDAHLYICGPAGLLKAAREAAAHWPGDSVHFELFASARSEEEQAELDARENQPFEIELAQSGVTLTVPADKTILDVLQENGIDMIYVCEDGWCGTCEVAMLGGRADHRDECLSDEEKQDNSKIQVCISRALPGEKLILDL